MKYRGYTCNPQYSEKENGYYGIIEGLPDAGKITAPTIDDFIRIYHQTVDDYLDPKKKGGGWVTLLLLIAIVAIAAMTCPDREKHVSVLSERIAHALSDKSADGGTFLDELFYAADKEMYKLSVDNNLHVDDFFIVSIGKVTVDGQSRPLTLGAFGHVFTMSVSELKRRLNDNEPE